MDTTQNVDSALGELARVYRDEEQPPALREQALAGLIETYAARSQDPASAEVAGNLLADCLEPVVRRLARRIAQGGSSSERADFADEAPALVLAPRAGLPARICSYQAGRRLEAWLRTVLRRLWVSDQRERQRRRRLLEDFARERTKSVLLWEEPILAGPLSSIDLARVASWDTRRRVEVLCLSGLWPRVPFALWEAWLAGYERLRNVALVRPFPPDDILICDRPADRLRPLAQRFGYTPNTLAVRWLRAQPCLNELDFVRELTPT